ncbi:MAG: daunorubicin resistance protein DrrA family ABC transporter ATP-binding protein [Anaerolineales bacterium]
MTEAIYVEKLIKDYPLRQGSFLRAIDRIDFCVHEGEVFGFLGPNGAGKTSTIRILTGLSRPTGGKAKIMGMDLASELPRIKKQIGVVPEISNLYDELTAFDNLMFIMQLYGVPRAERRQRADELLSHFGLNDKRHTGFAKLSRGMKRSLTIAAALAHRPRLVFLDEPTTGLDVMSARNIRQTIANLRQEGVTIFLTTHYLEEAERLCDRIAIVVKGKIVALDTIGGLKSQVPKKPKIEIIFVNEENQVEKVERECLGSIAETIQKLLVETGGKQILAIHTLNPSLEDVFVHLTGLSVEEMLQEKGGKEGKNAAG